MEGRQRLAACLGVFAHGRAADRIAERRGEVGMAASEVADEVPAVFQELLRTG